MRLTSEFFSTGRPASDIFDFNPRNKSKPSEPATTKPQETLIYSDECGEFETTFIDQPTQIFSDESQEWETIIPDGITDIRAYIREL